VTALPPTPSVSTGASALVTVVMVLLIIVALVAVAVALYFGVYKRQEDLANASKRVPGMDHEVEMPEIRDYTKQDQQKLNHQPNARSTDDEYAVVDDGGLDDIGVELEVEEY